jgi:hypothetical protein
LGLADRTQISQIQSMPKKKEPELDPKEQFKRFVETAREHGVDESGKEVERAFKKLVPKKPASKPGRRGN